MSARQAFVPSRPASRLGQLNELASGEIQRPSPGQHQRHNKVDVNNSSSKAFQQPITRGQENTLVQRPQTPKSKPNSDAGLPSDFNKHKPFNLSGLKKNKRDSTGGARRPEREVLGSMPMLPSSLDHCAHQIAAPAPLSGHMGNFKTPSMPWMHGSDAHIVGSPDKETDLLVPNGLLPSPVARRGRLESIQEAQELEEQEDSGYMSAQMAIGDNDNAESDAARRLAGLGSKLLGPRRVLKRALVDEGEGQEDASTPHDAKRTRHDTYVEDDSQEIQILGDGFDLSQNNMNSAGLAQIDNVGQSSGGDLTGLFANFGLDVDQSRMEEYHQYYMAEQRRWSEASYEDWRAGSKEIVNQFSSVLQMAMDHLTTKVATYNALHATLADHHAVLDARGDMNKRVRESLVRNGGNVLKVVDMETTRSKVDKSVGES